MKALIKKLVAGLLLIVSVAHGAADDREGIWGITDQLDDDRAAILNALLNDVLRVQFLGWVVTSGNTVLRAAELQQMGAALGLTTPVFPGTSIDLTQNSITAFAGYNEEEGRAFFNPRDRAILNTWNGVSGDAAFQMVEQWKKVPAGKKIDILLMGPATDLVKAIQMDRALAKKVLGNLYVMGIFKRNASGELSGPYNAAADERAVIELLKEFNSGVFEEMYHVPSDTVQLRSGLAGGYIPEAGEGEEIRRELTKVMSENSFLQKVFKTRIAYSLAWRDYAIQQIGMGFSDYDRWVPSSFQDPSKAIGFYMADTIPMFLAMMSGAELGRQDWEEMQLTAEENPTTRGIRFIEGSSGRKMKNLRSFDGMRALREHLTYLKAIDRYQPTEAYGKPISTGPAPRSAKRFEKEAKLTRDKALVMVFKNSPDDWYALIELINSKRGQEALRRGGIICEGFQSERMARAVRSVLEGLGETRVPVAAGHDYAPGEIDSISNFDGERTLNELEQAYRAFEKLPEAQSPHLYARSPLEIIKRASAWAQESRTKRNVDYLVLGEGIDVFRAFKKFKSFVSSVGRFYVMGGGRYQGPQLVATRNWLPHKEEVLTGIEELGARGKKVFIFSSDKFGGSFQAANDNTSGNGAEAIRSLKEAAATNSAFRAVYEHQNNWSRVFGWYFGSLAAKKAGKPVPEFNPNSPMSLVTISPLGLTIADEWLSGELEVGRSAMRGEEVSLENLFTGKKGRQKNSGVVWLSPPGARQDVVGLAARFASAIDSVVSTLASARLSSLPAAGRRILEALSPSKLFNSLLKKSTEILNTKETVVLGDVEGQWGRVESFFKKSGAFEIDAQGKVTLKAGYRFVFMGDAIDKGNSSLRILETLLALKEQNPEDVVLILGNRDINKLRLAHELSPEGLKNQPNEDVATQKYQEWMEARHIDSNNYSHGPTRLKWILEKTMGAPNAFEHRRRELEVRRWGAVSDQEVFESFLADFEPKAGIMTRYLRAAQLAFIDPVSKALFVHGGLTPEGFGSIPGKAGKIENLKLWIGALNLWARGQIEQGITQRNGAPELVKYQQPLAGTRANQASVIYGRNFDATANPEMIPDELQDKLRAQGVNTLVLGHTPVGEMPVLISNERFRIVFVDNSASRNGESSVVSLKGEKLHVSAPSPVAMALPTTEYTHVLGGESEIGKKTEGGWVVSSDGRESVVFRVNKDAGFKVEYSKTGLSSPGCRNSMAGILGD